MIVNYRTDSEETIHSNNRKKDMLKTEYQMTDYDIKSKEDVFIHTRLKWTKKSPKKCNVVFVSAYLHGFN